MNDNPGTVEKFIRESFEDNYQALRLEASRSLTPDGKKAALQQVLLYWQRMREVAQSITDTEVKLTLPNQRSPDGHQFSINGVVDIVRDDQHTIMYDIKTHDAAYVRRHRDFYEEQLNVYAHVWQQLRGEPLDETAIIATRFPSRIGRVLESDNEEQLRPLLEQWDPLVPIPLNQEKVGTTIAQFGAAVDGIEGGAFDPPDSSKLEERLRGNETFATRTCRNCDARFTCDTYRRYMLESQGRDASPYRQYLNDFGDDQDQEAWRTSNLDTAPTTDDLAADFGE